MKTDLINHEVEEACDLNVHEQKHLVWSDEETVTFLTLTHGTS